MNGSQTNCVHVQSRLESPSPCLSVVLCVIVVALSNCAWLIVIKTTSSRSPTIIAEIDCEPGLQQSLQKQNGVARSRQPYRLKTRAAAVYKPISRRPGVARRRRRDAVPRKESAREPGVDGACHRALCMLLERVHFLAALMSLQYLLFTIATCLAKADALSVVAIGEPFAGPTETQTQRTSTTTSSCSASGKRAPKCIERSQTTPAPPATAAQAVQRG